MCIVCSFVFIFYYFTIYLPRLAFISVSCIHVFRMLQRSEYGNLPLFICFSVVVSPQTADLFDDWSSFLFFFLSLIFFYTFIESSIIFFSWSYLGCQVFWKKYIFQSNSSQTAEPSETPFKSQALCVFLHGHCVAEKSLKITFITLL